jgi:hypothetical protein
MYNDIIKMYLTEVCCAGDYIKPPRIYKSFFRGGTGTRKVASVIPCYENE